MDRGAWQAIIHMGHKEWNMAEQLTRLHSPGGLPDQGIQLLSLMLPALADRFFTTVPPRKTCGFSRK